MKIESITLENFGIYKHRRFDFDAAPLVVVYGANESGKTTALNGIRQAIFGFRPRTPYLNGPGMSAEVSLLMSTGSRLEFSRRKGRPDTLVGTLDETKLNPTDIQALLCNLDLDTYEHLFGFSQDELRQGQDALKSARLTEAFAGGTLGGIHSLDQLRSGLDESLATLFKPRGSTSQINVALAEIRDRQRQLRESEVLPTEIDELRRQLRTAERESERLSTEHAELFRERATAEKLLQAIPVFRQRRATSIELDAIDLPDDLDESFINQWSDFNDQRSALVDSLAKEKQTLELESAQRDSLVSEARLFEYESQIESLGHQASEVESLRAQLRSLREQHAESAASRARTLENLQLKEVSAALAGFVVSVPQRQELEQISSEYSARHQDLIVSKAQLESAKETLDAAMSVVASEEPPTNLPELMSLTQKLLAAETELQQQTKAMELLRTDPAWMQLTDELTQLLDPGEELDGYWQLPTELEIAANAKDADSNSQRISRLQEEQEKAHAEVARLQSLLASAQDADADRAMRRIEDAAQRRDALISEWLDELSQPLIASSIGVNQQADRLVELQSIVKSGDDAQAELLLIADSVAHVNQQKSQVAQLENRLKGIVVELSECISSQSRLQAEWQELWSALPVRVQPPEEMRGWLNRYQQWRVEWRKRIESQKQLHRARGAVQAIRDSLLDCWPSNLQDDADAGLIQEQVQRWEQSQQLQVQEATRIRNAKETLDRTAARVEELDATLADLIKRFDDWLTLAPIDVNWPIEKVTSLLDAIESARSEHRVFERTQEQIESVTTRIASYEESVQALATRIQGPDSGSSSPDDKLGEVELPEILARRWLTLLHEQRESQAKRVALGSTIGMRSQRCKEMQSQLTKLDSKIESLAQATRSDDVRNVASLIERVRHAAKLRAEVTKLSSTLLAYTSPDEMDAFLERLENADESSLQLEVQELASRQDVLESERKTTHESIGSLTERIERMANGTEAQRNLQLLQNCRGELAELAEQWMVEQIAKELLSRSIELFAKENEPALMRHAREYLRSLTGGRYTEVEHDKVNKGQFLVRNAEGEAFTPERLSTGTREQLYLAIRMAFISHHCEESESLPVIMDDCFVNFDDTRTRLALESALAWDDSIQTVVLSCHTRVPKLVAELAPETPVICLDRDTVLTAAELSEASIA